MKKKRRNREQGRSATTNPIPDISYRFLSRQTIREQGKEVQEMTKYKMPSGIDAEKWIDPDTFLYKGKLYTITPEWKIVRAKIIKEKVEKVLTNHKMPKDASDAEKWIDTDIFIYKGRLYTITPKWKIKIVRKCNEKLLTNPL